MWVPISGALIGLVGIGLPILLTLRDDLADFTVGFYAGVFIGLPGPRMEPMLNLPVGFESLAGAEASIVDAAADANVRYGATEFGLGFQLLIIGADVSVDPFEIVDFLGGFFLWDPRGDDL